MRRAVLESIWQDIRYGLKSLTKSPGLAVVAVAALALGVGANSAIFSFVNATLIKPLPFDHPERLVTLSGIDPFGRPNEASASDFLDWRDQAESFSGMAAWVTYGRRLTGGSEPEHLEIVRGSAALFSILGVEPLLGRNFAPGEDEDGASGVAILSHWLWASRFGADPAILGRTIILDGKHHTVVGVMPAGFLFPDDGAVALWTPLTFQWFERNYRTVRMFDVIARLAPAQTIEEARAEINTIAARLEEEYPDTNEGWSVKVTPAHDVLVGSNPLLLILLGAVGFVLLIACANVASLLLARAANRTREIAIRTALGAGRLRLVRQLLAESLVLALMGGALGLVLAVWVIDLVAAADPGHLAQWNAVAIDANVLGFALGLSLLTAVVSGLAPAVQASHPDLSNSLKEGSRLSTTGSRARRVRGFFVIAQVAMALVLLAGAGLLINSFIHLRRVDPGFNPDNMLVAWIDLPESRYQEDQETVRFFKDLLTRVRSVPGVEAAAAVTTLPMREAGSDYDLEISVEGRPSAEPGEQQADFRVISDDYFRTLGIPLVAGRRLDERDADGVVLVNQTFVRTFLADANPVGAVLRLANREWRVEIIGVVGDVRHRGLDEDPRPEMYVPIVQAAHNGMNLVVRTRGNPMAYVDVIKRQVYAVDGDQPLAWLTNMDRLLYRSVSQRRFNMLLLGSLAALGLVLAATGIYSIISYSVSQRTREIGIRMAIGAKEGDVLRMMVLHGMRLAAIGLALGLLGAFALTHVLKSLLFGVGATDPTTFALVSALLMVVAFAASYIPARAATRVDPIAALRHE